MPKYLSSYRCTDCKHTYERVTHYLPKKNPACPECKQAVRIKNKGVVSENSPAFDNGGLQGIIDFGQAPSVGGSVGVKAVDATAELVMKDYGMTDLNMGSHTKPGDTCAPKLAPHLQSQADGMFGKPDPAGMVVRDINTGKYVRLDSHKSKAYENYQKKLMGKVKNGSLRSPEVNAILSNPGKPKYDVMNKV